MPHKHPTKSEQATVFRVYRTLAVTAAIALLVIGALAWWAHSYVSTMVRSELAAQKVYFPPKGSAAFDPKEFPDIQQYAGQLVDTPEEAQAYANGFIARHLEKLAGGKTYSEVSDAAMKDPGNQKLQQQKATLFQGEALRGILLGTGYAFGTIGEIAGIAAYVCAAGALALLLLGGWFQLKLGRR